MPVFFRYCSNFLPRKKLQVADYLIFTSFWVNACHRHPLIPRNSEGQFNSVKRRSENPAGKRQLTGLDFNAALFLKFSFEGFLRSMAKFQTPARKGPKIMSIQASVVDHQQSVINLKQPTYTYPDAITQALSDFRINWHDSW